MALGFSESRKQVEFDARLSGQRSLKVRVLVLHGGEGGHEYLCVVLTFLELPQRHVLPLHGVHAVLGDALVPAEALDL